MPGTRCSVAVCNNSLVQTRREGKNIRYHRFPKNIHIKKKWIRAAGRTGEWNPETSLICSTHFLPHDYLRDLKSELLGLPLRTRLGPEAVPTQNIGLYSLNPEPSDRTIRIEKRKQKEIVQELLELDEKENEKTRESVPIIWLESSAESAFYLENETSQGENELTSQLEVKSQQCDTLMDENKKLKNKLTEYQKEIKNYKKQIRELQKKVKVLQVKEAKM